jgi:hypothetical protein
MRYSSRTPLLVFTVTQQRPKSEPHDFDRVRAFACRIT